MNGDCCSATCTAEPDGGACDDGEVVHQRRSVRGGNAAPGRPSSNGTPCDDGSLCTADACQAGACVGVTGAGRRSARTPTLPLKSQLLLKDRTPDKSDQVVWKWTQGAGTTPRRAGRPDHHRRVRALRLRPGPRTGLLGRVPAGGTCAGSRCWKTIPGKGFTYKDKDRTPDGMEKLSLKAGVARRREDLLEGQGRTARHARAREHRASDRGAAHGARASAGGRLLERDPEHERAAQGEVGLSLSASVLRDPRRSVQCADDDPARGGGGDLRRRPRAPAAPGRHAPLGTAGRRGRAGRVGHPRDRPRGARGDGPRRGAAAADRGVLRSRAPSGDDVSGRQRDPLRQYRVRVRGARRHAHLQRGVAGARLVRSRGAPRGHAC